MLETNSYQTETSPCSYQYTSTIDNFTPSSHFPNLKDKAQSPKDNQNLNMSSPYNVKENLKAYIHTEEECNYKIINSRKMSNTGNSPVDGRFDYTPGDTWYGKDDNDIYRRNKLQDSIGNKPKTAGKARKGSYNGVQDYGKIKKEEKQVPHPFMNNILRELRRQSKADYTQLINRRITKQTKEFDFSSPQTKARTRALTNTNSPNINLLQRDFGDNSFSLSPQPYVKKGRKLKSATTKTPNIRPKTSNIPKARLGSEGRCIFPQNVPSDTYDTCPTTATGYSEVIKTETSPFPRRKRNNSNATNDSQSSNVHSKRRDSHIMKIDDKSSINEDRKQILNASSYDSEKNSPYIGPFLTDIKEERRGKRLNQTHFDPRGKVHQAYYMPQETNYNRFNSTIGRFSHSSPEERQAELKQRRNLHLKQEREKAKFIIEDRNKRIQVLLKSRIITKFDKIKERLDTLKVKIIFFTRVKHD